MIRCKFILSRFLTVLHFIFLLTSQAARSSAVTLPQADSIPQRVPPQQHVNLSLVIEPLPPEDLLKNLNKFIKILFVAKRIIPRSDILFAGGSHGPPLVFNYVFVAASSIEATQLSANLQNFVTSNELEKLLSQSGLPGYTFSLAQTSNSTAATDEDTPVNNNTQTVTSPPPAVGAPSSKPSSPAPATLDTIPSRILPPRNVSRPLLLLINSPVIGFSNTLKRSIIRQLKTHKNQTSPPGWFLHWYGQAYPPPAEEQPYFLVSFVTVTVNTSLLSTLAHATMFVDSGNLTSAMQNYSSFRNVSISVVPDPPISATSNKSANPPPSPSPPPAPAVLVSVPLHVSAPLTGLPAPVVESIIRGLANATNTLPSVWSLFSAKREPISVARNSAMKSNSNNSSAPRMTPGAIAADYQVIVANKSVTVPTVQAIARFVRSRKLDAQLVDEGLRDVRVRLRPRLTKFDTAMGGRGSRAVSANATTVVASIVGVLVVLVVAAIILTLVPRTVMFGLSRSEARTTGLPSRSWLGRG